MNSHTNNKVILWLFVLFSQNAIRKGTTKKCLRCFRRRPAPAFPPTLRHTLRWCRQSRQSRRTRRKACCRTTRSRRHWTSQIVRIARSFHGEALLNYIVYSQAFPCCRRCARLLPGALRRVRAVRPRRQGLHPEGVPPQNRAGREHPAVPARQRSDRRRASLLRSAGSDDHQVLVPSNTV